MPTSSTSVREDEHAGEAPSIRPNPNSDSSIPHMAETGHSYAHHGEMHTTTNNYPPEQLEEAAGQNGRVWTIYRDRNIVIDDDLLQGWNDTLNVLLVFAGLFSAVCAAFLIEVSKSLQTDWQRANSLAVYAIYAHLNSTNTSLLDVPNPLSYKASSNVRWTNGLWFVSLTLSLGVSLLAILAKQWLNEFKSLVRGPASSPKMWALRHRAFKDGLDRWGMSGFISTMPLFLHAALFLFLAGLCLLLWPLDIYICGIVVIISGLVSLFYVVAGLAPLLFGDCPTATPGLRHLYVIWNSAAIPVMLFTRKVLVTAVIAIPYFLVLLSAWMLAINFRIAAWIRQRTVDTFRNPIMIAAAEAFLRGLETNNTLIRSISAFARRLWFPMTVRGVWQYRHTPSRLPAFDQVKVLATDLPLWEATALSWMIRMSPTQDDVVAALAAVGSLSAGDHHAYFHSRNQGSPLVHEDVQRAAEDTLESIATLPKITDNVTTVRLLRACVWVSMRPPTISHQARQFLISHAYAGEETRNDLRRISKFIAVMAATSVQDAGSYLQWSIGRLAFIACEMCEPKSRQSIVSAVESHMRKAKTFRRRPTPGADSRLEVLFNQDWILCASNYVDPRPTRREISAYIAAMVDVVSDPAVLLPRDLQNMLHFITTPAFLDCQISVNEIHVLIFLLLKADCEGRSCIHPIVLRHLLHHFDSRGLPVLPYTRLCIQDVFQPSPIQMHRLFALWQYSPAELVLRGSHLSLLQPVAISVRNRQPIETSPPSYLRSVRSPWSQLLAIMPMPNTAEIMSEMACMYSILLLGMHRHGYPERARAMLRELLPRERGAAIIAQGTKYRYHLAVHAKVIDLPLWEELCAHLLQPDTSVEWTSTEEHPDAVAFVNIISTLDDCPACPHYETGVAQDSATWLTLTNELMDDVPVPDQDSAVSPVPTANVETQQEQADSHESSHGPAERILGDLVTAATEDVEDRLERGQSV